MEKPAIVSQNCLKALRHGESVGKILSQKGHDNKTSPRSFEQKA
jgi:hypothetical protein